LRRVDCQSHTGLICFCLFTTFTNNPSLFHPMAFNPHVSQIVPTLFCLLSSALPSWSRTGTGSFLLCSCSCKFLLGILHVYFYAFATQQCWQMHYVFWLLVRLPHPFVHLSGQILLLRYFMNGLSNCDETYSEYSVAHTDDLIRFWRSKVIACHRGGEGIHVDCFTGYHPEHFF